MHAQQAPWWSQAVFYQIYPRSFKDSDGDGIGDLSGILEKLDYLQELGVDALWVNPCFPSPMADFGYDVRDYTDIDPQYGTLATMDTLIAAVHARGMRIVLDFVPNHTSEAHPWFLESRASRDNPRRDWYIWSDASPSGSPPNNWMSYFGGSAWEWDQATQQFYLHSFLKEQPDLNWRNPQVQSAMHQVLRFWLERGADGFRVDAVLPILKDLQLRDDPVLDTPPPGRHIGPAGMLKRECSANQPELHGLLVGLRALLEGYSGDRVLVGEVYTLDPAVWSQFYGDNDEFHLVLNVALANHPWEAGLQRGLIEAFEGHLPPGAQPTLILGSHDENRAASRWGELQARTAAVMQMTLPGTPFVYYGEELGMLDGIIPLELRQDPWPERSGLDLLTRDPERTPMQWEPGPGGGFSPPRPDGSVAEPWLPLHPGYPQLNVAVQREDPASMLTLYRKLIRLRRQCPELIRGTYQAIAEGPQETYLYYRTLASGRLLIALNFGSVGRSGAWGLQGKAGALLSSYLDRQGQIDLVDLELRPYEGLILRVS